jgi:hypothetical protein
MTMAAAQNVTPVKKPNSTFSQLRVRKSEAASTAPTSTAKPIIMQLSGRISRTNPPSLLMSSFSASLPDYSLGSNKTHHAATQNDPASKSRSSAVSTGSSTKVITAHPR